MTKIISQNYAQVLKKLGLPPTPTLNYRERLEQIFKDLNRLSFLNTNSKTFKDCINAWTKAAAFPYRQGNMDASIASILLKRLYYGNPIYPKPPRVKDFSFAYFNDQGKPCAVSISYVSTDPKAWVAAVIQNASSGFKKSTMNLIGSDELMNYPGANPMKDNEIRAVFLNSLGAKELEAPFKELILSDGSLNIDQLERLNEQIEANTSASNAQELVENKKNEYLFIKNYFNTRYFSREIDALEEKNDQIETQLTGLNEIKNDDFDTLLAQSFYKRHINTLRFMAVALVPAITLLLILSGAFAPLGLPLAVGLTFVLLTGALGVNAFAIVLTGIKMAFDALKLSNYHNQLDAAKNEYDHYKSERRLLQIDYDMKLDTMGPLFERVCTVLLRGKLCDKTEAEIEELIEKTIDGFDRSAADGLVDVPVYPSPIDRSKSAESYFDKNKELKSNCSLSL